MSASANNKKLKSPANHETSQSVSVEQYQQLLKKLQETEMAAKMAIDQKDKELVKQQEELKMAIEQKDKEIKQKEEKMKTLKRRKLM